MADFTENSGRAIYLSIGHGFGDNLMATAVIAGIKREFPDMRIFVFTKRRWEIFDNNPDVTACWNARVVMKKNPSLFRRAIPLTEYTYADFRNAEKPESLIDRMYNLIGIQVKERNYQPRLYLTAKELDYRKWRLQRLKRPLVAIAPSGKIATKIPNKFYEMEKWQKIAELLAKENITFIQVGDKAEGSRLAGAKDWRNLGYRKTASVLRHCDAVISHVGGMMHLATAVNVPCVTLFGGVEDPYISGYKQNLNMFIPLECSPCWLEEPCKNPICKTLLSPEKVVKETLTLIKQKN